MALSILDADISDRRWITQIVAAVNSLLKPAASATPANNGELEFELTNNTTLTVKVKGTDGTVRSGTITLS